MRRCNNKTISLETNQYRKLAVYPYSSQHLSNVCISALTYWHHHQVMLWSNEEHASVRLLFKQRIDKIFTFQISADWDKEYNTCSVGPWCLVQQCAVSAGEASTHPLTCQGRGQVDGCSVTNTLLCSADAATAVYTLPNVMFPFIHLVIAVLKSCSVPHSLYPAVTTLQLASGAEWTQRERVAHFVVLVTFWRTFIWHLF